MAIYESGEDYLLKESGYITVGAGGQILLTDLGREKAESIYERHVNITRFFEKVLNVSRENAEHDACKIEHIISTESYEKLKQFTEDYVSGKES